MNVFIIIISIIITLLLGGVVFFMFAIWRAILGKSTVDLKLATSIDMNSKRLEQMNKNLTQHNLSTGSLSGDLRDNTKALTNLIKSLEND